MSWEETIGLHQDRAKGGYLTHYVQRGVAICGFEPSAVRTSGRQMKRRDGWTGHRGWVMCHHCQNRADTKYRAHLLNDTGDPRL